jgi:hypothetical protein
VSLFSKFPEKIPVSGKFGLASFREGGVFMDRSSVGLQLTRQFAPARPLNLSSASSRASHFSNFPALFPAAGKNGSASFRGAVWYSTAIMVFPCKSGGTLYKPPTVQCKPIWFVTNEPTP